MQIEGIRWQTQKGPRDHLFRVTHLQQIDKMTTGWTMYNEQTKELVYFNNINLI